MPPLPNRMVWEQILQQVFQTVGQQHLAQILQLVSLYPNPADLPAGTWARWGVDLQRSMEPHLSNIHQVGSSLLEPMVSSFPVTLDWELANQSAAAWAKKHSFSLVKDLTQTNKQVLQKQFNRFFTQRGMKVGELEKLIAPQLKDLQVQMRNGATRLLTSAQRAKLVATTEVTRASVQGEQHMVAQIENQGLEMSTIWDTQNDDKVCPLCRPRDDQEQGTNWTDPPPGHPGCYCNLRYVPTTIRSREQLINHWVDTGKFDLAAAKMSPEEMQAKLDELTKQLDGIKDRSSPEARKIRKQIRGLKDQLGIDRTRGGPVTPVTPIAPRPVTPVIPMAPPVAPVQALPLQPPLEVTVPRTKTLGPRGSTVSQAVRVNPQQDLRKAKEALSVIDQVHGDGPLPRVPLKELEKGARSTLHGQYSYRPNLKTRGSDPVSIAVKKEAKASHPRMTTIHEVGHFIDQQGLGTPGRFSSTSYNQLDRDLMHIWKEKIQETKAFKTLKARQGELYDQMSVSSRSRGLQSDMDFIQYLTSEEELFARSYAQYIAEVGDNSALKNELEDILRSQRMGYVKTPGQWEHDDFVPVKEAFDELFISIGWRR